ncbi:choline kinase [Bacillus sp. FJAT-27225]|uniref:phosphocholine cytidylyltransferase/choline kinase family protein n=1 Tax=Bacillus sp. FJAT-27225 TaxID=1743144 RepID=UPI00080C34E1|nr:phosphocholine cytidylyltransferase/choline kinase family protein [Bacillus sp. FJAT-27225]OCA88284.1 choline kinase [Bacillus sp. FJAT-27225]
MEDLLKILERINKDSAVSQKKIAGLIGLSIGKVNYLTQELIEKDYIYSQKQGRNMKYFLTNKGMDYLKKGIQSFKEKKVNIHASQKTVDIKLAVFLAAGYRKEFDIPAGMLEIKEKQLIKRNMEILQENGINKFVIVTGYKNSAFNEFRLLKNVELVENNRYKWTGSMASLAAAKNFIHEDFLLIEDDILIEENALKSLLQHPQRDSVLITNESGSGDEAYVEIRDGYLYQISKDIHQLNQIDGEMIGISKLSYSVFEKMLYTFENYNNNPYLNYEYMILDVARNYDIGYLKINNIVWAEVDTLEQYDRALKKVFPILQRKEAEYRENQIKDYLVDALNIKADDISDILPFGGMTNKNFKVSISGKDYVLRLAGSGTEKMINRPEENYNSKIASRLGIDTDLLYFNEKNGMKVAALIPNAETLNGKTAKREDNMAKSAALLRRLHDSKEQMANTFNVFEKIQEYESLLREADGSTYPEYLLIREQVMRLKDIYENLDFHLVPSHNDPVPENFVKSGEEKMYLIDWEYAGMNDPLWDIAAHSLECEFAEEEEELFLRYYYQTNTIPETVKTRILMNKIFVDFLWTIWTNIKEAKGEDFGTYGWDRFKRAKENLVILNITLESQGEIHEYSK